MFGKIYKIDGNELYIKNEFSLDQTNLINCHVIFEEQDVKYVGEIVYLDTEYIKIILVGEITNNVFSAGAIRKPSGTVPPRIINQSELELIIGKNEYSPNQLLIGTSAVYHNFKVSISLNDFFANHSAIIGNTGAGKSCGVTRILQNLFINNQYKPYNAHFVLFDAYGEYVNTFQNMNAIPNLNFKRFTTKVENDDEELLQFPAYVLEADDLAVLLSLDDASQIPVLEKTLKLVYIFKNDNPQVVDYKNNIIAKCLLDILTSGNTPSQSRDQILAVLTKYNTETLNLESLIKQPGYNRTIRQCLNIDEQGKINAIAEVMDYLNSFVKVNLEEVNFTKDFAYTLDDLYYALEFALISEGTINSTSQYDKNNIIKDRLLNIINSEYKNIFTCSNLISKPDFIKNFFQKNGEPAQLININLSHVDDRFAKVLTKLYSKIFFNFTTKLKQRGSFSINIILEEAHRYVQNDTDIDVIGYNIFDRITKEGRKYGTMLTFITQRPSELSTTALSQCSNFLVFRLFHPEDLEIVKNISTSVTEEVISKLKMLNPGTAMIFGVGLKLPILVKLELPNPVPESTSLDISSMWFKGE